MGKLTPGCRTRLPPSYPPFPPNGPLYLSPTPLPSPPHADSCRLVVPHNTANTENAFWEFTLTAFSRVPSSFFHRANKSFQRR